MTSLSLKYLPAIALGVFSIVSSAGAALITNSANLPPDGVYLSTDIHQTYGGAALEFLLSLPEHAPIAAQASQHPGGFTDPTGVVIGTPADEVEFFPSVLQAQGEVKQNGITVATFPINANGPVMTIVYGKIGNTTGTFDTEMLSMDLSGVTPLGPFMIRESPTKASTGKTSITDIGGGLFRIDSFFDVFTELSIDGGATWLPSNNGAGHVELVPEPASTSLFAIGLIIAALGYYRSRS